MLLRLCKDYAAWKLKRGYADFFTIKQLTMQTAQQQPTHFHSFIVKGVTNLKTDKSGWKVVGLWGDEDKAEGNRIGPTFEENQLDACEALADELENKYGLPVEIAIIISHFTGVSVGCRVETKDGIGTVEEVRAGVFPFLVRLENGGSAWQDRTHIISILA